MTTRARTLGLVFGLAVLAAAVDQVIKGLVTSWLARDGSLVLWPDFFSLTLRHNTGAAFSLLHTASPMVLLLLSLVVMGVFLALIWPHLPTRLGAAAAVLVLGGALGNCIDRVRLHYVVDYLDFHLGTRYYWPTFNLADVFVVIGVFLLGWVLLAPTPSQTPEGISS